MDPPGDQTHVQDRSGQGQLQGANQAMQGIASVIGPIVFGTVFAWSVRHDGQLHEPGLAIFLASGMLVGAFLLALKVGHAPKTAQAAA